jgi:hypothetical protein
MGGYIGAKTGTLVASASDIRGDISATDATPEITLKNTTETDADGTRSGKITFKGEQSGGEESVLAQIQGSHDGTADDEKGDLIFKTNDGSDGTSPTERLRIDSNGSILTASLGTDNVHLGEGAGDSIASGGNYNVAIGKDAGTALTTGDNNVAVGFEALSTEDANGNSTAIGYRALKTQNAGAESYNVAVGVDAGLSITTGTHNTLIGGLAGDAITDGTQNTAVGYTALGSNVSATQNTAVGYGSLASNTSGGPNTAVGRGSLNSNTTGSNNTGLGTNSLNVNTTGTTNTAVGTSALQNNTTASQNTSVGYQAGYSGSTGAENTNLGFQAGYSVTTGLANTMIGRYSGGTTTGSFNTFLGTSSGANVTSGQKHTIIGRFSGNQNQLDIRTGSKHIVMSDGDGVPRGFCDSQGAWRFTSDNAAYVGGHTHTFAHNNNDTASIRVENQHGNFTDSVQKLNAHRSATSAYNFFNCLSNNASDNEFILRGDGNAYADGSWNGGGADYAEYFEWKDGNSDSQDRTGYTVVLDGNKIKLATSDDAAANVIGAVSVNPSVIGDSDIDQWKGKYLKDEFGAYQTEEYTETWWIDENNIKQSYNTDKIPDDVTVPDDATVDTKDAKDNMLVRRKLNPDYDADQAYVSREDRKEWATIGMMGKLRIRKGQPTGDRWIKMRDISDTVEEWLVR